MPLLATVAKMPVKVFVAKFSVCPKLVASVPLTTNAFPNETVFEFVVATVRLFNKLVVPAVVWSKLSRELTAPPKIRLLKALPFNPCKVVLVTVPFNVKVAPLMSTLPPFRLKSEVTVVAPDNKVFPKTIKFSAVPLKEAKLVVGFATITISSNANSSKSVVPETVAPLHLKW